MTARPLRRPAACQSRRAAPSPGGVASPLALSVLVLVLVALSACAVPTTGRAVLGAESRLSPLPVRWQSPGSLRADVVGGAVAVEQGDPVLLEGWVPSPSSRLVVVSASPVTVLHARRLRRPDVPADGPDVGFRLLVRDGAGGPQHVCVLALLPDGRTVELSGSDPVTCPPPPA